MKNIAFTLVALFGLTFVSSAQLDDKGAPIKKVDLESNMDLSRHIAIIRAKKAITPIGNSRKTQLLKRVPLKID